jgi:hypothetical protein
MFDFSKFKRKLLEAERRTGLKAQRLTAAFVKAAHPVPVLLTIGITFLGAHELNYPGQIRGDLQALEKDVFDGLGEAYTTSAAFLRARGFCMHVKQGSDVTQAAGCQNQMAQSEGRRVTVNDEDKRLFPPPPPLITTRAWESGYNY